MVGRDGQLRTLPTLLGVVARRPRPASPSWSASRASARAASWPSCSARRRGRPGRGADGGDAGSRAAASRTAGTCPTTCSSTSSASLLGLPFAAGEMPRPRADARPRSSRRSSADEAADTRAVPRPSPRPAAPADEAGSRPDRRRDVMQGRYVASIHRLLRALARAARSSSSARTSTGPTGLGRGPAPGAAAGRAAARPARRAPSAPRPTRPAGSCVGAGARRCSATRLTEIRLEPARRRRQPRAGRQPPRHRVPAGRRSATSSSRAPRATRSSSRRSSGCSSSAARSCAQGDRWIATDEHRARVEIPETLHGLLLARIDQLPDEAKRSLRVAAVIGRQFPVRVLERVLGRDGRA